MLFRSLPGFIVRYTIAPHSLKSMHESLVHHTLIFFSSRYENVHDKRKSGEQTVAAFFVTMSITTLFLTLTVTLTLLLTPILLQP